MPIDMPVHITGTPISRLVAHCTAFVSRRVTGLIGPGPDAPHIDPAEEARLRSEFVQDMLCANPAAFQSEQDVQAMLYCLPGRF